MSGLNFTEKATLTAADIRAINEKIEKASYFIEPLIREIERVIVGQKELVEGLVMALLADGHVLLEGLPGLAKTLAIKTLAASTNMSFSRIQFTPDILPADITGTLIYNHLKGEFTVRKGPIFSNFVLADEINRAPAKVQSALLECMQERQVTIGETTYKLPQPFLVMATQNPIEQEGTYNLPEAQVDRFLFKIIIGYPAKEEEIQIIRRNISPEGLPVPAPVVSQTEILEARKLVKQIYIDEKLLHFITDIVFATRYPEKYNLSNLKPYIAYGASPRASIYLAEAARARAFMKRRGYVIPEDIRAIAHWVLNHRIILSFEAEAENISTNQIIKEILSKIEVP